MRPGLLFTPLVCAWLMLDAGAAYGQSATTPGSSCATGFAAGDEQAHNNALYLCTTTGATRNWYPEALYIGTSSATCNATNASLLRYNAGAIQVCNGTSWTSLGGTVTLSSITAAAATNSIANAGYAQTWNWDSLAGASALKLAAATTAAASNAQKLFEVALSGANSTSTQTTYGAYVTNTHTGTSATNVGLYASASGGTTNYAALFPSGYVGIGNSAPNSYLHVGPGLDTPTASTHTLFLSDDGVTNLAIRDSASDVEGEFWVSGNDDGLGRALGVSIGTVTTHNFRVITSDTVRIQILSSGEVGIGTQTPNTKLDISGYYIWSGQSRVSSTFSKTSDAALAAITGLSATLTAAKTYYFEINLYTTSGSSGGINVDLNGGTATATALIGDALSFDAAAMKTQTRFSALNTSLCAVTAVTAANCRITGTITVNAGGTFIPRFAQNASNGTASTVAIGSTMEVMQIN